jgi:tetratricopeptide (TPR) repeat protein
VEKAFSLLREAAEKGSAEAKGFLGEYYLNHGNYEEARRWYEAAASDGGMYETFRLGMMIKDGEAFDQNEQTRAEAFRLITISATLLDGLYIEPALELSTFFRSSTPVNLHYLRPAVEGGDTDVETMDYYAVLLLREAISYYGRSAILAPGHSPVPEAMFWYRQCSNMEERDANHPLVRLEREIRKHCAHCRADLPEGKQPCCVECKAVYYCSRDCQVAHWKAGHKKDCVRKLKKRLKAAGTLVVEPR